MKVFRICFSFLFVTMLIFAVACSSDDSTSSESTNIFFNAAKDTAPVFNTASTKAAASENWDWGGSVYEIYAMFRDYDPDTDEGTIGLENIYKVMYQAGSFFNECNERGTSLDTATSMTSPFDFGRTETYTKYLAEESANRANYFATKVDGDVNNGLLCWYIDGSDGDEHGILQGSFNESTKDIDIDLVCFVDYDSPDTTYSIRMHLEGNSETHTFTDLRVGKWNYGDWDDDSGTPDEDGYIASYNGAGVAQGTGQYSLFLVSDNSSLTDRYFEFPADTDETYLKTLDDEGLLSPTSNTSAYQSTVDALTEFDVLSSVNDVATDSTDFSGTGMGNMKPTEMP